MTKHRTSKRFLKNLEARRELQKKVKKNQTPEPTKVQEKEESKQKPTASKKQSAFGVLTAMAAVAGGVWNPKDLNRSKHRRQKGK